MQSCQVGQESRCLAWMCGDCGRHRLHHRKRAIQKLFRRGISLLHCEHACQISESLRNLKGVGRLYKTFQGELKFPLRIEISAFIESEPAEPSHILRSQVLPKRTFDHPEGHNENQETRGSSPIRIGIHLSSC